MSDSTCKVDLKKKFVIFCDFDGTITVNDNIIAIMKQFQPPGWDAIVERILSKQMTIREGVGTMFSLLPTSRRAEIEHYSIHNITIRDGFAELLAFCKEQQIEFFVTSGGIDFFVYPTMAPFAIERDHIYCNHSDFSGDTIRVTWPHPCDEHCQNDCGMCKTTVMRRFPPEEYTRIVIGDSITDVEAAKIGDLVFARSHLIESCKQLGIAYHPYESFHEVASTLKEVISCPS